MSTPVSASNYKYEPSLSAYGYDASHDDEDKRRVALDSATACFGFVVVLNRMISLSDNMDESSIEKQNMVDDIIWFNGMSSKYGTTVLEQFVKYQVFE